MSKHIWTIGHWTCPESVFLETLDSAGIEVIVDVRAHPGSRRSPQFGQDAMSAWLASAGITYRHLPALGGRRSRQAAVDPHLNDGWHNDSFRNFADYTLSLDYEQGIGQLTGFAGTKRVAVMCGEPMPWRCHRLLIANTLTVRGWLVWHLMTGAAPRQHKLGQWGATPLVDADGRVTYPHQEQGVEHMSKFKVGDSVSWNSEAGRVSGTIAKIHTTDVDFKGHTRHASQDEPQYEIKSDKTDHVAMHKESALTKKKK